MFPNQIVDSQCVCGESPLWHPDEQRLYFVDIDTGRLFRYDPARRTHETLLQGEPIGAFTLQEDGSLLLFMARGAIRLWSAGTLRTFIPELPLETETRFNDVAADPRGRVFCGTMPSPNSFGRLYRLDPNGSIHIVLEEVGCSNGIGFSPDHATLYFTDSDLGRIDRFDYDENTGALANRRVFAQITDHAAVPDGLTVDAEGFVWSAIWDGGAVVRFDPDGKEERRIVFPVRKTSNMAFGGPGYADLFVTTAGADRGPVEGPGAGGLFHVRPGVLGVPENRSRIRV
jgi:D-xylonolactonase